MSEEKDPPDLRVVPPSPQHRKQIPLTEQDYENLAAAYLQKGHRSIRTLAEATGHNKETCARAISRGWPTRRWPSLKERATLYDAEKRKNADAWVPISVIQDAEKYRRLRNENLDAYTEVRGVARAAIRKIAEALQRATADRSITRSSLVDVVVGKRTVQKIVREVIALPPSLTSVAAAVRDIGSVLREMGVAERAWLGLSAPAGSEGAAAGIDSLTDDELDYISVNGGKLPPGVTPDQLRRK